MKNLRLCIQCKTIKNYSSFDNKTKNTTRPSTVCISCKDKNRLAYYRTPKGRISQIYRTQIFSSKARGHNKPAYTKDELFEYITSHEDFDNIFKKWEESNYNKMFTPSIDRLNDYLGYSFDNIRFVPYIINVSKAYSDRKNGIGVCGDNSCLKVKQLSLKGDFISEFYSMSEASRKTGLQISNISRCCRKERKSSGGFMWEFSNPL